MKSVIQEDDKCYICRMAYGTEWHHIFGGPNRKHSEEDGLKVRLCRICHDAVHFDKDRSAPLNKALHKIGQEAYEENHTREEFMKRYGRNHLEGNIHFEDRKPADNREAQR